MSSHIPIHFGSDLNVHDKMTFADEGTMYRKDLAPGTIQWSVFDMGPEGEKKSYRTMWFVCPCGCGNLSSIPIVHPTSENKDGWGWDGNEQQPTLTPSIQKLVSCRWHGHLVKGVFVPC